MAAEQWEPCSALVVPVPAATRLVGDSAPVQALATEVPLLWIADGVAEVLAVFPFGTAAA